MEKLNDLRFIIGSFFNLAGGLLVLLGLAAESQVEFGKSLNLWSGLAMLAFGGFMLWTSRKGSAAAP